jgi:acyl carrier protein
VSVPWDSTFEELLQHHVPYVEPGAAVPPDVPLVEQGVDSAGLLRLMMAVENAYAIQFAMDQLNESVFRTARSVWAATTDIRAATSH